MSTVRIIVSVSLGAVALSGCARNLCDGDPENPLCMVYPAPGSMMVTVSPARLSLSSGGTLAIEVKPLPPEGSSLVLRRQGAMDLVLGSLTDGKLTTSLKPADLTGRGFTPGAAQIALVQPDEPDRTAALRLFVDPKFDKPAKLYDTSVSSDFPLWVTINKTSTIYTLNQFPPFAGSADRQLRIGEYQLTNNALAPRVPQTFGSYRAYPFATGAPGLAALARLGIVLLTRNPVSQNNPILADYCLFTTAQCQSINPTTLGFKSASVFAADRQGSLFAVQTELGPLAYRASEMNPFAEKLAIDSANRPTPGAAVAQACGDLDGDGQSDLIVFQSAPTGVSVFLGQPDGRQLRYNDAVSERLQTVLGTKATAAATVADIDADGLNDLLVVRDGAINLFLNQGNGTLAAGPQITALPGADSLMVGAMDSVPSPWGKLDIAVTTSTGQHIAVFLNQAAY